MLASVTLVRSLTLVGGVWDGSAVDIVSLALSAPSAVLVAGVRARAVEGAGGTWRPGPLPITQHFPPGSAHATDEQARRTLIAGQQADVLYGSKNMRRSHLLLPEPETSEPCVFALELLMGPETGEKAAGHGILAIHVVPWRRNLIGEAALADYLDALSTSVRGWPGDSPLATRARALLPEGVDLDAKSRMRNVSFAIGDFPEAEVSQRAQEWAYFLVTTSSHERWPDMARRARSHPLTIRRQDWSALVLRDGAAFIGHQTSEEPFTDALRVYTHSIHLDAILLGMLQRRLVDLSGERAVSASLDDPGELVELERSHFEFKRSYWRTSLTSKRQSPSDDVLRAFQSELLTALDVAEVEDRVRDGARLARTLHGERQLASQQAQAESQQRLARMVQNVSVIVGAFGLAFTAAPTLATPSFSLFAMAAAAGVVGVAVAFGVLKILGRRH